MNPRDLKIEDFNYPLPEERIAFYPLPERDASKLLAYRGGAIEQSVFRQVGDFLPQNALLVFNDTRVVRARLVFFKGDGGAAVGARIEIFCLEPSGADIETAFSSRGSCRFKCLVGNNKRWKQGALKMDFPLADGGTGCLQAVKVAASGEDFEVEFSWSPTDWSFAEVLEASGKVPLPPYIRRQAEEGDTLRYQTVFARHNGSVAAPTAGLHFTQQVLEDLQRRGIERDFITLHVGAGTFKPVKAEQVGDHAMHSEHIVASKSLIENLLRAVREHKPLVAVGTTSMRSMESLYWMGVRLACGEAPLPGEEFEVNQWDPYETYADRHKKTTPEEALQLLCDYMERENLTQLHAHTSLMIAPGYKFAFCKGIITNFHQPKSTLLLLVSALIGDVWKEAYRYALAHDFRFLSYGDSCLFLPEFLLSSR